MSTTLRDMVGQPRWRVVTAIQVAVRDAMIEVYGSVPQICIGQDAWADDMSLEAARRAFEAPRIDVA